MKRNAFYAQSGGVTSVINATAASLILTAKKYPKHIGKVYAGKNGIIGALNEELIDTFIEPRDNIAALRHQPGSAFGSCRYKLKNSEEDDTEAEAEELLKETADQDAEAEDWIFAPAEIDV